MWSIFACGDIVTLFVQRLPHGVHMKGKWLHPQREEAQPPFNFGFIIRTALRPDLEMEVAFNQSGTSGTDTAKSLDLIAGGEIVMEKQGFKNFLYEKVVAYRI